MELLANVRSILSFIYSLYGATNMRFIDVKNTKMERNKFQRWEPRNTINFHYISHSHQKREKELIYAGNYTIDIGITIYEIKYIVKIKLRKET